MMPAFASPAPSHRRAAARGARSAFARLGLPALGIACAGTAWAGFGALLAALGSCVAVGLQANAVARGFGARHIGVDLEAEINITSVWGTGDLAPRPVGFQAIRLRIELDLDGASEAERDALIRHAVQWSPVLNTVRNPVDVIVTTA